MKYRVNFKTMVQTDGYSNPAQDYDERPERLTVTVNAKSVKEAKSAAVALGRQYLDNPNHWPSWRLWSIDQILSVKRVKSKKKI